MDVSAQKLADAFGMSDQVWDRHANPLSGWTRMPVLPLLAFSIYARVWIGWWCVLPIAMLLVWTWINPRAFPPPERTDNWMSEAVFGERVWLNAKVHPIPRHHVHVARILNALSAAGMIPMVWGLWALDAWAAALGTAIVVLGKLWFLDRMVWLYRDMAPNHPHYSEWMRKGPPT